MKNYTFIIILIKLEKTIDGMEKCKALGLDGIRVKFF